jgi:tRNA A-37 threonylcarbamoyl transferase component Bud32
MGEVYRVRHLHLQEERVIKILRPDRATDPGAAQRFLNEARIATQIKHANVAILYDYSRLPDGSFYMVWEHLQGEDVGTWLRRRGPFPLKLAVELGIQSLRGLEAIHAAGVIHRDLSPDNLMITKDVKGRALVKIIDLGLAKNLTSEVELTEAGTFMGKLRYCSPEQAGAVPEGSIDHRSDIYSLAAVLYEMICGRPPYESETQHGFVLKRLSEDPLPLVGRNPEVTVPRQLAAAVLRGLERDRERRYADAVEFIHALVRVADALRGVETREMTVPREAIAAAVASGSGEPRRGPARELSKEEKVELLAQIDRAARRVEEGSQLLDQAREALDGARFEDARRLLAQAEAANPRLRGLPEALARLRDAEAQSERRQRVRETEQLVERYVAERKQTLAQLALDTLVDLHPTHPKRSDYEAWVKFLAAEVERAQQAQETLAAGREALRRGDLRAARRQLDLLEKNDQGEMLSAALAHELDEAERDRRQEAGFQEHRQRFDDAVERGRFDEARRELETLHDFEVTKVTLDFCQKRLQDAEDEARRESLQEAFERRYREQLAVKDWFAARQLARELQAALPQSQRPAQMLAEVARLSEIVQRQEAAEQGVRQVEAFIAARKADEAELALKILVQMDPDNPQRRRLERQVRGLR